MHVWRSVRGDEALVIAVYITGRVLESHNLAREVEEAKAP